MSDYRYPWPASAITPDDMAALHAVRESSLPRVPISRLVAHAIRETYGMSIPCSIPETSEPGDRADESVPALSAASKPRKIA